MVKMWSSSIIHQLFQNRMAWKTSWVVWGDCSFCSKHKQCPWIHKQNNQSPHHQQKTSTITTISDTCIKNCARLVLWQRWHKCQCENCCFWAQNFIWLVEKIIPVGQRNKANQGCPTWWKHNFLYSSKGPWKHFWFGHQKIQIWKIFIFWPVAKNPFQHLEARVQWSTKLEVFKMQLSSVLEKFHLQTCCGHGNSHEKMQATLWQRKAPWS